MRKNKQYSLDLLKSSRKEQALMTAVKSEKTLVKLVYDQKYVNQIHICA